MLKKDPAGIFRFGSLQGAAGQALLQQHDLPVAGFNSFVLIEDGKVYTRSSAALKVVGHLKAPWSWLRMFWIIPKPLRDMVYDWIARNRYRWFGQKESCWLPQPKWKDRFLD